MTLWCPPFVTETDEALWTDCTWSSGLMLANKATATDAQPRGRYPSTRGEREALRAASGDRTGGSSLYDLRRGITARYGWTLPLASMSWTTFLARMKRGDGAVIQGLYSALPVHYQRWSPSFALKGPLSTHAVYVQATDRGQNIHLNAAGQLLDLFWCDPLGRGAAYRGEWIPVKAVKAFVDALGYMGVATMPQGGVK